MRVCDISEANPDLLARLIKGVSLFDFLLKKNPEQYDVLLNCSKLIEVTPGEIIVRSGDPAKCLYGLLSGRLLVFRDKIICGEEINCINAGEIFGDLSLLGNRRRRATVISDPRGGNIVLLAINAKPFCHLDDCSVLHLETKLIFYRAVLQSLYWKLEMNRMLYPGHLLAETAQKISEISSSKGSYAELEWLYVQASKLADQLVQWNQLEEAGGGVLLAR